MWQPNRKQWIAIWIGTLLTLWLWIDSSPTYPSARHVARNRQTIAVAVVAALVVWQLGGRRKE
jgi:hypothetical protein